jgi:hypothetical protein
MRQKRIIWFFIMIALGAVAGMVYGWVINPVKYVDTSPASLRADYKADYVLMVAEIYSGDGNLEQAGRRLSVLSSLPPARVVADALLTARELQYGDTDLQMIDHLAQALKQSPGGQP